MKSLPSKLLKSPLVHVVFEIRFNEEDKQMSSLIKNYFKKTGTSKMKDLNVYNLPKKTFEQNKALEYLPLLQIKNDKYDILMGKKNILIITKNYDKWDDFKDNIKQILFALLPSNFKLSINSISLKYVNFLPKNDLNFLVSMGSNNSLEDKISLKVEREECSSISRIELSSSIRKEGDNIQNGLIVNINTLKSVDNEDFKIYLSNSLESKLNEMHMLNKKNFFDLIKKDALLRMEPKYEE